MVSPNCSWQIRLVALPQRQLQILQRSYQAAQITAEHHVEPVHHVEARRQSEHQVRLEPPSARLQLKGAASNGPGAAPLMFGVRMELERRNWSEQVPDWRWRRPWCGSRSTHRTATCWAMCSFVSQRDWLTSTELPRET